MNCAQFVYSLNYKHQSVNIKVEGVWRKNSYSKQNAWLQEDDTDFYLWELSFAHPNSTSTFSLEGPRGLSRWIGNKSISVSSNNSELTKLFLNSGRLKNLFNEKHSFNGQVVSRYNKVSLKFDTKRNHNEAISNAILTIEKISEIVTKDLSTHVKSDVQD